MKANKKNRRYIYQSVSVVWGENNCEDENWITTNTAIGTSITVICIAIIVIIIFSILLK